MKTKEVSGGDIINVQINDKTGIWQPETFINITSKKINLSKMIRHNHLKMLINGEEYWIPFIKGQNKKKEEKINEN